MTFFVTLSIFFVSRFAALLHQVIDVNTDLFPKDEYDLTRP